MTHDDSAERLSLSSFVCYSTSSSHGSAEAPFSIISHPSRCANTIFSRFQSHPAETLEHVRGGTENIGKADSLVPIAASFVTSSGDGAKDPFD